MTTDTTFQWKPHRYRDIETGNIATDPRIEHADNGRPTEPGHLRVTLSPYVDDTTQLIVDAPSWPKPYYTRGWGDREQARGIAHRLLSHSLTVDGDLSRDRLGNLIDKLVWTAP